MPRVWVSHSQKALGSHWSFTPAKELLCPRVAGDITHVDAQNDTKIALKKQKLGCDSWFHECSNPKACRTRVQNERDVLLQGDSGAVMLPGSSAPIPSLQLELPPPRDVSFSVDRDTKMPFLGFNFCFPEFGRRWERGLFPYKSSQTPNASAWFKPTRERTGNPHGSHCCIPLGSSVPARELSRGKCSVWE